MPPAPAKQLSPAELAKLEHAFATDPASEAYKPLAEAYLGMGRFMEAMVVCKKGVKAHPTTPDARMLLARVYADQGKDKKALEELAGALLIAPKDKTVLRFAGSLQLKSGEAEAGKTNLLKAWEADPEDAETKAALAQYKIETPKAAAPEPPTEKVSIAAAGAHVVQPRGSAPVAGPGTRQTGARPIAGPPPAQARGQAADEGHEPTNGARARGPSGARRPSQVRTQQRPLSYDEPVSEPSINVPRSRAGRSAFIFLLVTLLLGGGGYFGYGQWHGKIVRAVKKELGVAGDQLKHDSFDSYKKAVEAAERALDSDSSSSLAHAYLAYAWAIRWGEHGGGDDAKRQALEHLEAAKKKGDIPDFPYLVSADALIKTYDGKAAEAQKELEEYVQRVPGAGLALLTLGIIQMNQGDLEKARESLNQAQQAMSSDPRVYAALGTLYRRRGEDEASFRNYDSALKFERDHAESILGVALLLLERENPQFEGAAKSLKKVLDADPPASPRQLAMAHLSKAFLVSRVNAEILDLAKAEDQKSLSDRTGVPMDKAKAAQEVNREEESGFTLDRGNPDLHLIKGRRLLAEGQVDPAVAEYKTAIKMDPSRANYYVELSRALIKADRAKEAVDALQDAIRRVGESPKLMTMLGQAYRKQGKLDDAVNQFKRSLTDPKVKNPEARLNLGSTYYELKKYPEAIETLQKAALEYVGQKTREAMAYEELGRTFEATGDKAKAEEAYKKSITAGDNDYPPAFFFYGRFLMTDPLRHAPGIILLKKYLELDPRGAFAAEARKLLGQ